MSIKSQRSRAATALALGMALTLLLAGTARAATIEVNSSADPADGSNCTLRQAIENAENDAQTNASCAAGTGDDTITFDGSLLGETITLDGNELVISPAPLHTGTLTIQGPGAASLEVSAANASRVFHIAPTAVATANAVTIHGLTISNGSVANANGGGILNEGSLSLDGDLVSGNTATGSFTGGTTNQVTVLGGGIESSGGRLTVTLSQIAGNSVSSAAAGGSTSNTALARGAGIHASGDLAGILTVDQSSIYDNTASAITTGNGEQAIAEGGGVWSSAGAQTGIARSTIANNTLVANGTSQQETGGGVEINITQVGAFAASLLDDTVTGNDAANTGANLAKTAGALQIQNTIVADASGASNCSGVTSLGHNLSSDASCGSAAGDIPNTPPNLLPLGLYGGSTSTRPPAAPSTPGSSPAIDQGLAAGQDFDQRELQRTWDFDVANGFGDGTDIGAVEIQGPVVQSTDPASPNADQSPRVIGTAEPGSLVELHPTGDCSDSAIGAGTTTVFASPGIAPTSPLALGSTTTFHAASFYGTAESICSPSSIAYTVPAAAATTTPTTPTTPTTKKKKCKKPKKHRSAVAAKKKCKKKHHR